jgi:hypothetical protein
MVINLVIWIIFFTLGFGITHFCIEFFSGLRTQLKARNLEKEWRSKEAEAIETLHSYRRDGLALPTYFTYCRDSDKKAGLISVPLMLVDPNVVTTALVEALVFESGLHEVSPTGRLTRVWDQSDDDHPGLPRLIEQLW